jgi:hypothetical protein
MTNEANLHIFIAAVYFTAFVNPALAQRLPSEIAEQWGLLGTWAFRCNQPASRSNTHYTYEPEQGGKLIIRNDYGDGANSSEVTSAAPRDDGGIELTFIYKAFSQIGIVHIEKTAEGNIRAISNRDDQGRYTIRDGKLVGSGWPSLPLTRCKPGT